MAVKLTTQNVITALGLRFWMSAMEDLGISSDVTKCMKMSQYLTGVISNNQQVKICKIEDMRENNDLFVLCFAYGVQFWEQVVADHDIQEINHCKTVLEYCQRVIRECDFDSTEEINLNSSDNFNDIYFGDSPPNSPAQTQNVLIKFKKKTNQKYIYPKKSKEYNCDFCEKDFWTFEQVETHVERKHPDLKNEFEKKYLVFKCEWGCVEAFNTHKRLKKHYKFHHSRIIKCDYCPEESATPLSALNHIKETHPEMKDKFDAKFRVHKCSVEGCDKKFFTGKGLTKHKIQVHRSRNENVDSNSTLCSDCGASFSTFKELKKHKSSHKRPYIRDDNPKACNLCGETVLGKYRLEIHMFKAHDVGALFCDDCGEKFQCNRDLKCHKEKMHLKIKFDCSLCGKSFDVERYLDRHMKRVHTSNEERKHKCDQCGKGFACKETYVGHMNMHLGLKPFKCEYCGAAYQNNSNLLAHLKKSCKNITVKM